MPDSGFILPPTYRVATDAMAVVSGGRLEFYLAGTNTATNVYSDSGLVTSLGSTVYLDSGGHPVASQGSSTKVVIYTGADLIKIILKDANGATLATYDNLQCAQDTSGFGSGGADGAVESIVSKTADYTVLAADDGQLLACDPSGGTFAVTLPSAATVGDGFEIAIRHSGTTTTNRVRVVTTSSQTIAIDGVAVSAYTLVGGGEVVRLASNGGNWVCTDHTAPKITENMPLPIADRLSAPPGSPTSGAWYILTASPSGAWSTFAQHDLVRSDGQGGWHRYTPTADCGWLGYIQDEDLLVQFRGSAWVDLSNIAAPTTTTQGHITVAYQLSDGTVGGAVGASSNTWYTRLFNTTVKAGSGTLSGVTLSSNALTNVPAGTYLYAAALKFGKVNSAQFRIRGTTAGILDYSPTTAVTSTDEQNQVVPHFGVFTLASSDTVYLENAVSANANDTSATGAAAALTGVTEVYATLTLVDLTATQGPQGAQGPQGPAYGAPQTALELAAGVTPTNTDFPPGDLRRYGADPTGVSSSHTAFANACKTGHLVLGGGAYTYLLSTNPGALTTSVVFDGQGCTLKTSGNVYCFYRNPPAATATVTISSGATEGTRTITCASTTGLVVGQICHIDTVADDHPPSFNTIVAINAGTGVVTLDRQLRHTYTGTLSLLAWTPTLFLDRLEIRNTTFDGALSTSAVIGEALRAGGYRRAVVENCLFKDWSGSTNADTRPVVFIDCLDVIFNDNRSEGQDNQSVGVSNVLFFECGTVECSGNSHEGHGFGFEPVRCDHARLSNNSLIGLSRREFDDAETAQSVRGIKAIYCGNATVTGNTIEGYESPLKIDDNFSATITGNTVRAALGRTYSGQVALNCAFSARTQAVLTITGNTVEGCDGIGIGISYAGAGLIEPSITGNVIRNAQHSAIFLGNVRPTITGNTISDWGLRNSSDSGIYHPDLGGLIVGNSFRHATLTSLPCIRDLFGTGYNWEIDANVSHSGNSCIGKGSVRTLASASSMFLGAYPEQSFVITGTTTINNLGSAMPGRRVLRFTGALTLTRNASLIETLSGASITVAAGDVVVVSNETGSGGLWRVLEHHRTNALGTLTLANGANNDVVLPGNRTLIISGPTLAFSVSGFAGGTDGERRTIINPTAQNMTITNDATSTAANRILTQTGADVTHTGRSSIEIIYSATDSRWLMIGAQS